MPKRNNVNNPAKQIILSVVFAIVMLPGWSQTLFTYGKHAVSKNEFLKAYQGSNIDTAGNQLTYDEYLDLYIRFRLKVQAALDEGFDTMPAHKAEMQSFRYQLAENFLKEEASIDVLVNEAFERSLKDIHLSHIFVPVSRSAPAAKIDEARKKIDEAYKRLAKGEAFAKVASAYSHAQLGYVTAFVLPYAFENIAYSTKKGAYSPPFQTSSGFHIIRNNFERNAAGKIRAAQILLAYPQDTTEAVKKMLAQRADSLYNALKEGADFASLALQFSDDAHSYHIGGEIPAFGVGQYDTLFEKTAFGLKSDGDISKPISTSFGYHIIKRLQHVPVITDRNNKDWLEVIRERVLQSDRMQVAHNKLVENIRNIIKKDVSPEQLASDSAVIDYYRNHLEKYNAAFAEQMNEFRQGNLLFAIMQKKVWDAASEDTAALRAYYEQHKQKYFWENSADALIITCLVGDSVEGTKAKLRNNYANWRQITEDGNSLIQSDSGRFELNQIPVADRTNFTEGLMTAPVINEQDSSYTFAYIIKLYKEKSPKNFADARGAVINDYQVWLEEKWIADLKNRYPVKVNRKVYARLKQ